MLRRAGSLFVDALYPKRCSGCDHRGAWVCDRCLEELPLFAPPWCARCGMPNAMSCRCHQVPVTIARHRSAGAYDGWLRAAIHRFKYEGETARVEHLAKLLLPALADLGGAGSLVPVPLHSARYRERGFNQSMLLAEKLSALTGVPVWNALARTRNTAHQVGLDADSRARNVEDAFTVREQVAALTGPIVLVDDVFTTGATMRVCSEALLTMGRAEIWSLTLC